MNKSKTRLNKLNFRLLSLKKELKRLKQQESLFVGSITKIGEDIHNKSMAMDKFNKILHEGKRSKSSAAINNVLF